MALESPAEIHSALSHFWLATLACRPALRVLLFYDYYYHAMQAELKKSGWSDAVLESLRYLFASEQEVEEGSALDPLQWFQALINYREIPNVMTAWKQELSEQTEQQVFQVSQPT